MDNSSATKVLVLVKNEEDVIPHRGSIARDELGLCVASCKKLLNNPHKGQTKTEQRVCAPKYFH
eukprot:945238-Amphidinium_carterae.3